MTSTQVATHDQAGPAPDPLVYSEALHQLGALIVNRGLPLPESISTLGGEVVVALATPEDVALWCAALDVSQPDWRTYRLGGVYRYAAWPAHAFLEHLFRLVCTVPVVEAPTAASSRGWHVVSDTTPCAPKDAGDPPASWADDLGIRGPQ